MLRNALPCGEIPYSVAAKRSTPCAANSSERARRVKSSAARLPGRPPCSPLGRQAGAHGYFGQDTWPSLCGRNSSKRLCTRLSLRRATAQQAACITPGAVTEGVALCQRAGLWARGSQVRLLLVEVELTILFSFRKERMLSAFLEGGGNRSCHVISLQRS